MASERATIPLPPGQRAGEAFPRFGAASTPVPAVPDAPLLRITGMVEEPAEIKLDELESLPRHEQVSDLHCVTTWTKQGLRWGGWRLADLYRHLIVPRCHPAASDSERTSRLSPFGGTCFLVLFGLDGYRCSLLLEDALSDDVLIADTLDGEPLSPLHGAPLRVVSPRQYAYKNLKHLCGIGLRSEPSSLPLGLEHPRGRVALEERHAHLPAWLVRLPYQALIGPTAYRHRRGLRLPHHAGRPTLLGEVMPEAEHHEVHDLWLDATPEDAFRALAEVTGREIRLLAPLMVLRGLPAYLTGRDIDAERDIPTLPKAGGQRIFDDLERSGFVRLAEDPGREIVFGVVGRFWKLAGSVLHDTVLDRESFTSFAKPGYAKAAMSLLVRAEGRGSRLITETRIIATDPAAARSFRRYWRLIRPGSGLIRRGWLAAVRRRLGRRAER